MDEDFKKIKKSVLQGIAGVAFVIFFFSSFRMIAPGEVGVLVNLFGDKKGVEEQELNVGCHIVMPWKSLYRFPIYEQNHQWEGVDEGFSFQTSEGLSVHSDVGITFNLSPSKVHELFCKYRRGMEEITHLFIRNHIRDAINVYSSKMKIEDLLGPQKEWFFDQVQKHVKSSLEHLGFNITKVYLIGKFGVPESVMDALNKKIEATQRAQQRENELREAEAQVKKDVAVSTGKAQSLMIESKAKADSNRLISTSLTSELLQWQSLNKWDGKMPTTVAGSSMPFILGK